MLLDGAGQGDGDAGVVAEALPASGGLVYGEWLAFGEDGSVGVLRDVLGEEDDVVLPFGVLVDPEAPAFVGDEGSVLGVRFLCSLGFGGF